MLATESRDRSPVASPDLVRAAFRDLHARRLHGFALLLTLGDRQQAARLAARALVAGARRLDELRHPERAAAWLRAQVTHASRGRRPIANAPTILAELGADAPTVAGLTVLSRLERAALIAAAMERFDRRDVATIVGRDGQALDRLLARAQRRYSEAFVAAAPVTQADGPLAERIRSVALRAMS